MSAIGSSPLARGLQSVRDRRIRRRGIIPARAGFTAECARAFRKRVDHPRSRGVYYDDPKVLGEYAGSSPLARGLRPRRRPTGRGMWIIPARAGFTIHPRGAGSRPADHPRSRGVYRHPSRPPAPGCGSSPLARGLRHALRAGAPAPGIIPARAGFTRPFWKPCMTHRGSSPLARGLQPHHRHGPACDGIIPARAGFTSGWRGLSFAPRGSSPLARGLPEDICDWEYATGIIPARAGFTPPDRGPGGRMGDHPRSRGVYLWPPPSPMVAAGSSPLARGLPVR